MLFSLTGGIGSGKSTVSNVFRAEGVVIVDADVIAHQVLQRSDVIPQLVAEFGDGILTNDLVDRRKLGSVVFKSKDARRDLEKIVLPIIRKTAADEIVHHIEQGKDVCFDAPTLIESGDYERYRPIVVIDIPMALQLMNVTSRGLTMIEAFARIDSQLPLVTKLNIADYVIKNYGTVDELRATALKTLQQLRVNQPVGCSIR
jgi:dephospho-CoA kinase